MKRIDYFEKILRECIIEFSVGDCCLSPVENIESIVARKLQRINIIKTESKEAWDSELQIHLMNYYEKNKKDIPKLNQ